MLVGASGFGVAGNNCSIRTAGCGGKKWLKIASSPLFLTQRRKGTNMVAARRRLVASPGFFFNAKAQRGKGAEGQYGRSAKTPPRLSWPLFLTQRRKGAKAQRCTNAAAPAPQPGARRHGRTQRMPARAPEGRATSRASRLASSHPRLPASPHPCIPTAGCATARPYPPYARPRPRGTRYVSRLAPRILASPHPRIPTAGARRHGPTRRMPARAPEGRATSRASCLAPLLASLFNAKTQRGKGAEEPDGLITCPP